MGPNNFENQNRCKLSENEERSFDQDDAQTDQDIMLQYYGLVVARELEQLEAVLKLAKRIEELGGSCGCHMKRFLEYRDTDELTMIWAVPIARRSESLAVAFANESFDIPTERVVVKQMPESFPIDEFYWR